MGNCYDEANTKIYKGPIDGLNPPQSDEQSIRPDIFYDIYGNRPQYTRDDDYNRQVVVRSQRIPTINDISVDVSKIRISFGSTSKSQVPTVQINKSLLASKRKIAFSHQITQSTEQPAQ